MSGGIKSILIVGIDETLRQRFRSVLGSDISAESITFHHEIPSAIAAAKEKTPSLLVLEWNVFPVEEMTTLLQKFRAVPRCSATPVLIISDKTTGDIASISVEYDVFRTLAAGTAVPEFKQVLQQISTELSRPNAFRIKIRQLERATEENDVVGMEDAVLTLYNEFPDSHRAKIEYANLCLRKKDYEGALNAARKALAFSPDNLRALNVIARAHLQTGKYPEAIKILERSDALSPGNVERLVALGDGLFAIDKLQQAKAKYQAATKIDASCQAAKRGLVAIELSESNFNNAVELLRDSEDEAEVASLYNNIGIMAARQGQFEKAESSYSAALKVLTRKPLQAKVHFNLGLTFERGNANDKAENEYRTALELVPSFEKCKTHLEGLNAGLELEELEMDHSDIAEPLGKVEIRDTLQGSFPVRILLEKQKKAAK